MKKVNAFTVMVSCMLLVSGAHATTYYVSDALGDDANDGLSAATAWATIQKAADVAAAGDIVMVDFGEYAESVVPKANGADGSPIVFMAEEKGAAIISTGSPFTDELVYTQHADSIWVAADVFREVTKVTLDGTVLLGKDAVDSLTAGTTGSWFQDRGEKKLYVIASDKLNPSTQVDTVSLTERSFDIVDGSYITIDGFTIKNRISAEVADDDVDLPGLVITNNVFEFDDSSALALEIDGGGADTIHTYESFLIDDNVFELNSGVSITCAGRNSVISDNTFNGTHVLGYRDYADEREAFHVYGDGDYPGSGTQARGLVIERNFSNDCDGRHMYFRYGVDSVTVQNNIFYKGESAGIYVRNCTNMDVFNNTFFYTGDRDHLSKIYENTSVRVYNNIFAYTRRSYTWFHDNKGDTLDAVRLPFEIDYNYHVTDTSMSGTRDDESLRMRTLADGFYVYGEDSKRHNKIPGGPNALYGHPMVLRTSVTRNDTVVYPSGDYMILYTDTTQNLANLDTVTVDSMAYYPAGGEPVVRDSICDMWFQDAYPLFDSDTANTFAAATAEDFKLAAGSNAIDAAYAALAPAQDFFNLDRDANPDVGAIEFGTSVSVKEFLNQLFPTDYELSQNYPNPFNLATRIEYKLPQAGYVKLTVYNLLGQKVVTLVDGIRRNGPHTVTWNARDGRGSIVPSGIYFCRLEAGSVSRTMKMLLLK